MKAMVLNAITDLTKNREPLTLTDMPEPLPSDNEVLIKIMRCGVCHTELDEIEGRTPPSVIPMIPGHQAVGRVARTGGKVKKLKEGDRVGAAWIYSACGRCDHCRKGNNNLCKEFKATGRDAHGGYAEYMTISEDFAFPIPALFTDSEAAPMLCAGAIGYRSLRLTGIKDGENLGLTGFGASGHLVLKLALHQYPHSNIFVFARNPGEREFAMELGAEWAGNTTDKAPVRLNAIIDTTPVWKPVLEALLNLAPNGRLVINAIRKEDADKEELLTLDYPKHLWMEKEIKSVANVAPADVEGFLEQAARIALKPEVTEYPLSDANTALLELKESKIRGAKVLRMD